MNRREVPRFGEAGPHCSAAYVKKIVALHNK